MSLANASLINKIKFGVPVFPGTNCDQDVIHVFSELLDCDVVPLWHRDDSLQDVGAVIVPGGFSYGDYLRTGALAKLSPIMHRVRDFAAAGGPVLGICNGFQILCEAGLLPGVLLENVTTRFISRFVTIRVEQQATPFTRTVRHGALITCPIAHFQGNYFADADTLADLEKNGRVVFRYVGHDGDVDHNDRTRNPNGSCNSIAGICNDGGNVVGLMPHPERAVETLTGGVGKDSGLQVFRSILD